jgi:hypothetical protein
LYIPPTQRRRDELEQHDAFIHACMGLIRIVPRFDELLSRLSGPAAGPLPEPPILDDLLNVALGAIALRLQLAVQLERLSSGHANGDTTAPQPTPASRELLR